MLMFFISTMHNKTATKNRTTNIKTIKCADVSTCFTNGGTQSPKGAGHVLELTIKGDGKCSVRESRHMTLYATDFASTKLRRPFEIAESPRCLKWQQ
jgi:hypothetical protein